MPINRFNNIRELATSFQEAAEAITPNTKKTNGRKINASLIYSESASTDKINKIGPESLPKTTPPPASSRNFSTVSTSAELTKLTEFVKKTFQNGAKQIASSTINSIIEMKVLLSKKEKSEKRQLLETFHQEVCEPLDKAKNPQERLSRLPQDTLDALILAHNAGILDRTLFEQITNKSQSVGLRVDSLSLKESSSSFSIHSKLLELLDGCDPGVKAAILAFERPQQLALCIEHLREPIQSPEQTLEFLKKQCPTDILEKMQLPSLTDSQETVLPEQQKLLDTLKTAYKQSLSSCFEREVCTPLREMENPLQADLTDLIHKAADLLVKAEETGILDIQFYKTVAGDATRAGATAAANLGQDTFSIKEPLASRLETLEATSAQEKIARFVRAESMITCLDNIAININEYKELPPGTLQESKMKHQHAWLKQNCPEDILQDAKFPDTPQCDSWDQMLETIQARLETALQTMLSEISSLPDGVEKTDALTAFATMCAFGGRCVGDLGDSLRGACGAREKALERLELLKDLATPEAQNFRQQVLTLLLSDVSAIENNQILLKTSSVGIDLCKPGQYIIHNGVPHVIIGIKESEDGTYNVLLQNNESKAETGIKVAKEAFVTRASVDVYLRESIARDQCKVLQKAASQLRAIAELLQNSDKASSDKALACAKSIEEKIAHIEVENAKAEAEVAASLQRRLTEAVDAAVANLDTINTALAPKTLSKEELTTVVQTALTPLPTVELAREKTVDVGGTSVTVICMMSKTGQIRVLIKTGVIGVGASGQIHKAISHDGTQTLAIKSATEIAKESDDTANEVRLLELLNEKQPQEGIQGSMTKVSLVSEDGQISQIAIGAFYEEGDLGKRSELIRFAINELGIAPDEIDQVFSNDALLSERMNQYMDTFRTNFENADSPDKKRAIVRTFRENTGVFIAKYKGEAALQQLNLYCLALEQSI